MSTVRIGSVCTGYGGLDAAVQEVFGGSLAWVADNDPGASRILAHHHPRVPNLGDITAVDWEDVEPVDIVCGGYPCQPFSLAGELKGTADDRHIWPFIARALGVLRPRVAVFENVANHLRLGFDTVLCDLADLGFDVEWCVVRADEVGAPHQRRRLIVLATAADAPHLGHERGRSARGGRSGLADRNLAAADAEGAGWAKGCGVADAGDGTARRTRQGESARDGAQRVSGSGVDWGEFAPAITRWETVLGRPAPGPTDDLGRLSPLFVEWLMGLPIGHVTGVPDLSRSAQLKALGNGVLPHQAIAGLRHLATRMDTVRQRGMGVAA
ncbi:DNA cytosine methyltransferase [Streptomyces sparsogenes]|uniref:DNA (cytosine-5-)-methyltransferase n=1 Tax=Streptomyces sparsogenes DSM 40356 TaxID=1331668 RepID=A0A1R1SHZ0_9ACTN|nr:DNA cytosine methyltransferase [Streptomyces sparsogenes]OMI37890.1 phage DNA methylase [Streptomyces sparsogenes DSM 40356]